jgi:hypothetical protein
MAEKSGSAISRREFARRAAIASAVVTIAPAGAVGATGQPPVAAKQTLTAASAGASVPVQDQLPPNMPRLSPEGQAEAEARFQAILAQYGGRFSDEQRADLRRLCVVAQPPLDRLRAYKVENRDGSGLYLKPLFEREKRSKPPAAAQRTGSQPGNAKPNTPASGASSKP